MRRSSSLLLAVALVSCVKNGRFDVAPSPPSPRPSAATPSREGAEPGRAEGVFELLTATSEDARRRMAERCPNGYRVLTEDFVDDGVGRDQAVGRGRSALPPRPREHVRVRFVCGTAPSDE